MDIRRMMAALETRRQQRGISVAELYRITGVAHPTWYAWIRGSRSPNLAYLAPVLDALGFDLVLVTKEEDCEREA